MSERVKSTAGNLAVQGGILAAASLIVRLIGFFYRIPLVRMLGTEGMGYYSSAFTVYSYLLVLSSYALPSALSKIISKKIALKRYKEAHQIFKAALFLGLLLGLVTSSILYFGAGTIASLIGNEGSAIGFKALAPSMMLFTFLAVFRGYFQGHNTMVPTALSQIIEQIFNAAFSLGLAAIMLKESLQMGAAGGTLGTAFGVFAGLSMMLVIYYFYRPTIHKRLKLDQTSSALPSVLTSWQIIYMTAIPMMIGSSIYNLSNMVDMVMFQRGLLYLGYKPEVVSNMYGLLESKYRLILTLPISIASALAAASIPSITASMARKEVGMVKKKATMAIKTVLMISIPSAFGLGFMAKPILWMLFGTDNLETAALLMQIGAVSVIFFSISGISIGILQGINKMYVPVRNAVIGVVVKIIGFALLIYVFDTGLVGAVAINVVFSMIVGSANFYSIQKEIKLNMNYKTAVILPLMAAGLMSGVALSVYWLMMLLSNHNTIATMVAIIFAGISYLLVLVKIGGLTEDDMKVLPMGTKLIGLARVLRLI